jgi:hypothetical protein
VTIALVDDQALGQLLRGSAPRALTRRELATTGYWYVRLCQAVLGAADRSGVLSRPFVDLPETMRDRALGAVLELPEQIALVSLRELAPQMGRLRRRHALNVLGMEVLAAAIRLEAEVFLSAPSPQLETALIAEDRRYRRLG